MNQKQKRHQGRLTARWAYKGKYSEEFDDGNNPIEYYDDWESISDGLHVDTDVTHIRFPYMHYSNPEKIKKRNAYLKVRDKIRRLRRLKHIKRLRRMNTDSYVTTSNVNSNVN